MKVSAKWSTLSMFGAFAFAMGAATYTGCTVTSGEVDDFDGGTGTRLDSGTASDAGATGDGGTEGTVGAFCEGLNQKNQLIDDACQACLEQQCCTDLKGCYNITPGTDEVSCDDYVECVSKNDCEIDPAADAGTDVCNGCRSVAAKGVVSAYNTVVDCALSKCKTECKQ